MIESGVGVAGALVVKGEGDGISEEGGCGDFPVAA